MSINGALLASNALFFALSAAAVVASIAVFLLTRANDRQKDRELAAYQIEARERIAELERQTSKAKLETATLRAAVSWREFPPDKVGEIVEVLASSTKKPVVDLQYAVNDQEAGNVADQMAQALSLAGYPKANLDTYIGGDLVKGIALSGPRDLQSILQKAFGHIGGLAVSTGVDGGNDVMITIGSKGRPKL